MNTFEQHRRYLFGIAYRMLGSVMESEDIVQEVYLRWQKTDQTDVESPLAYLSRITVRLCLDHLKSARVKREVYPGTWLPEPLPITPPDDPVVQEESISMAFLILLERLSPGERAVFLLREVFDYAYSDIASILDKSEDACRQLFSRARQHIRAHRPRFETDQQTHNRLLDRFMKAINTGNLNELETILAEDVVVQSDGGGIVPAARYPVQGREHVMRLLAGLRRLAPQNYKAEVQQLNGQSGVVFRDSAGVVFSVLTLDTVEQHIQALRYIVNPEKLQHLM